LFPIEKGLHSLVEGHTLSEQAEQASVLMQAMDTKPHKAIVDLGYRGVDKANPDIDIKHRGKFKSLTDEDKKDLKRRQAIEPIIGHLKADHRMNRCHLKWSRATVCTRCCAQTVTTLGGCCTLS
jgi:IS5 family transposase